MAEIKINDARYFDFSNFECDEETGELFALSISERSLFVLGKHITNAILMCLESRKCAVFLITDKMCYTVIFPHRKDLVEFAEAFPELIAGD